MKIKKRYVWILSVVFALLLIRISLPYLFKYHINKQINNIEGYYGGLEDVNLQLYRGGFYFINLKIFEKASSDSTIPIINLPYLDFSIQWGALFKGRLVGEVIMDSLVINFTKRDKILKVDSVDSRFNLVQEIRDLNPILINKLKINNSEISYKDPTSNPEVDFSLKKISITGENMGNVINPDEDLPATINLTATTVGQGTVKLYAKMNYLLDPPDFDYNFELEKVNLLAFNDFFEAYAKFDIEKGDLYFYSEGKALDGKLDGYIKPLIVGLEIAPADPSDNILKHAYEFLLEIVTEIFENRKKDQFGTKIPFSGTLNSNNADVLESFFNFLRNAFVRAYPKELESKVEQ